MRCAVGGCSNNPSQFATTSATSNIVAGGGFVYWTTDGNVYYCPSAGCGSGPQVLGSGGGIGTGIALGVGSDSANLYWATGGNLYRCSLPGCPGGSQTLLAGAGGVMQITSLATDGIGIYFTATMPPQRAYSCPLSGCGSSPSILGAGSNNNNGLGYGIASDGVSVFWADSMNSKVLKCNISGCGQNPITLASNESGVISVTTDGQNVYWGANNAIRKCATAGCGGTPMTLTTLNAPRVLVLDAGSLYVAAGDGSIYKLPP
jgi:hypothetical protein